MLLKNSFDVGQPLDAVWQSFQDIPGVAACLPGAELTDDLGDDKYAGRVGVSMVRSSCGSQALPRSSSVTSPASAWSSTPPVPTSAAAARRA